MPLETVSQALTIREQGYSNRYREQANAQQNDATQEFEDDTPHHDRAGSAWADDGASDHAVDVAENVLDLVAQDD